MKEQFVTETPNAKKIKMLETQLEKLRVMKDGDIADLKSELADAQEYLAELKQFAVEKVNEITELRNASIDCRICQHYCETNGCEMDDCNKGSDFRKSGTVRLWEHSKWLDIKIEGLL